MPKPFGESVSRLGGTPVGWPVILPLEHGMMWTRAGGSRPAAAPGQGRNGRVRRAAMRSGSRGTARYDEHRLLGDKHGVLGDALQAPRDEDHEHRPLASLKVVPDLDRAKEDLAVEPVDLAVAVREVRASATSRVSNACSACATCERTSSPIRSIVARMSASVVASELDSGTSLAMFATDRPSARCSGRCPAAPRRVADRRQPDPAVPAATARPRGSPGSAGYPVIIGDHDPGQLDVWSRPIRARCRAARSPARVRRESSARVPSARRGTGGGSPPSRRRPTTSDPVASRALTGLPASRARCENPASGLRVAG